ncbi:MAG: hypothetical protein IJM20_01220 [Clostridia bacterium]|nr:hypothetical protein [Clostridia bacterium]
MKKRLFAVILAVLMLALAFSFTACKGGLSVDDVAGSYAIKTFNGETLKEFTEGIFKKQGLTDELAQQGVAMLCAQLGCTEEQFYNEGIMMELNKDGSTEFSGYFIQVMEMMGQKSTFPDDLTWKISGSKIVFSKAGAKSTETEFKNGEFTFESGENKLVFNKK